MPTPDTFLSKFIATRDKFYVSTTLIVKNCILYEHISEWIQTGHEGLVVLFSRTDIPSNRLIFVNRKERNELFWDVKNGFKYKLVRLGQENHGEGMDGGYFFVFQSDKIYGIYIHDREEAVALKRAFDEIKGAFKKSRSFLESFKLNGD